MLYELDHPTFVEVIEKPSNVGVKHIVHLLLQERVRQRIQRLMLAAPRSKTVREAEKVLLIDLIEDGGHGVLDDFVFQGRDPQWSFPRSEEHTSELQSQSNLVCRLLLEKK